MSESVTNLPHVVDQKPVVLELAPKTYYWCSCGLSKNQPYCDGAHQGTGFVPTAFTLAETQKVALCLCKKTENSPYCDGSHAKL